MLLKMKSLLSFLVALFVLVVPCSATDNVSFFSRNASLLNGSLSILATASLTYEFGLADYRLAGRERVLGVGGTIGYAFAGYWGACARLSLHKSFNSQWNAYYGLLGGVYGVLQRGISPQPMYAPYLGLIFLCSRHWGINAEVAPLFLHSFIENQVVTLLPVLSLGVMQIF